MAQLLVEAPTDAAEQAGLDVLVSTDKNIRYQQNFEGRKPALIMLEHSQEPMMKLVTARIVGAVVAVVPSSYIEVDIPFQV